MNTATAELVKAESRTSLVTRMAARFGVEPNKMLGALKATAFHTEKEITNEQMMALLVVAEQYGLNPWTKEIYAFPDSKRGGIVPVVGLDGCRIINENPNFDGMTFTYGPSDGSKYKGAPAWIECTMYRKDRSGHPCTVRENLVECYRDTGPWQSHPARMLRHKTMIQCARLAFGFVGVYDPDEAERIVEGTATIVPASGAIADINAEVTGKLSGKTINEITEERMAAKTPQPFTLDDVRDALNDAAAGPYEAFAAAMDLMNELKDPEDVRQAEELANKLMHERADREAAKE